MTAAGAPDVTAPRVEFCGEWFDVEGEFTVGREADLTIDDNPYLHRHFLRIFEEFGMWWLANVGAVLTATVSDGTGQVQAWLAPGAKLPIVFETMTVIFSAGSTTYDFTIHSGQDFFNTSSSAAAMSTSTTVVPILLTTSQRQLVLSLAEGVLTRRVQGRGTVPSSADAAERLGWAITTFNRKLDNVCEKLDKAGVPGLRGGIGRLATDRKSRLVEYAVSSRLVTVEDLPLLDRPRGED